MIPLSLAEIAELLGADPAQRTSDGVADASVRPSGVVRIDSRDVEPGDVFACVEGDNLDGHDFAAQAFERGAVLALAERPVPGPHVLVPDVVVALGRLARATLDRRPGVAVVGITGSSGKTSTKDLLAQVLEVAGPTVSPPGSFNNEIGLPLTALRTDDDTRFLVLEMGARGEGHVRTLCAVAPPVVGVVLNVGSAHIGEFGDRAAIARAKAELVASLPADGTAILNADDPHVAAMAARTAARVVTFGTRGDADVRAVDVALDRSGRASFVLVAGDGSAPVTLRVVGEHQVSNALAAAAAALALGLPFDVVVSALAGAEPRSAWRMEVTESADGVTVVNDAYNANPESMRAALDALAAIGEGRRTWAVLGEMRELGEHSGEAHEAVGRQVVALGISRLVVVGDSAGSVLEGARAAGAGPESAVIVEDAAAAGDLLVADVRSGDVVLVKASRAVGLESVAESLVGRPLTSGGAGDIA